MNSLNRRLLHKDANNLDLNLSFDVDEYLIEEWPTVTAAQRKSVWAMASNDEDFDWSHIEEQLDGYLSQILEPDGEEEEEEDDEWSELDNCVWIDVFDHLEEGGKDPEDEDLHDMVEYIQENFDYTEVLDQIDALKEQFLSKIDPSNDSLEQGPAE